MSDADMMRFMASCMLAEGPAPSVETPLHSLLPHHVIAHTHDVATMSLTNVPDATAERLVHELFEGTIVYVPYVRPGFPLAKSVGAMVGRIPPGAIGLTLAHHGLVVWGDDAEQVHERLVHVVGKIEKYIAVCREGKRRSAVGSVGRSKVAAPALAPTARRRLAELVLPAVRGALGVPDRVILHYDDADDILATLAEEGTPELVSRGMATPEHLLRAGRLPVWLELDFSAPPDTIVAQVRTRLAAARDEYEEYHRRNASPGEAPLADWAKVVLARDWA